MYYLLFKIYLSDFALKFNIRYNQYKSAFGRWLFTVVNYRRYRKAINVEKKIEASLQKQNLDQAILINEIKALLPKRVRKGISLYILLSKKSKVKLKAVIIADFGERLKKCNLRITDNLKII